MRNVFKYNDATLKRLISKKGLGTCVVVLGMHRSGTSLVAGALSKIGVEFGDKLLPPKAYNPKGFFEHVEILSINEEILRTLGSSFFDMADLLPSWHTSVYLIPLKEKLKEVIEREFSGKKVFGFKDPRISILLPLYLEVIRELDLEARFVVCERPDPEVAMSFRERGFPIFQSLVLSRKYREAIEKGMAGQKYVRIAMQEMLDNPRATLEKIIQKLKLPLHIKKEHLATLESFVDKGLKNHDVSSDELLFDVAKELYEKEEEKSVLETKLNEIGKIHSDALLEIGLQNEHLSRLRNTLAHRDHRIDFLEKEIAKLNSTDFAKLNRLEAEFGNMLEKLSSIERSLSWKIVSRFQGILDTIVSPKSRLRPLYVKFLRKLQGSYPKIEPGKRKQTQVEGFEMKQAVAVDILFVNHEESRTGAPRILFEIAKEARSKYSIAVVSKQKGGMSGDYKSEFGDKLFYPQEILDETERHQMARAMLERICPKIVYVNSIISYEYASEVQKLGIPVIFHIHEMASAYDVAVSAESQEHFRAFADIFVAVSEVTKRDLIRIMKVPKERIRLVHEFIDSKDVLLQANERSREEVEEILDLDPDHVLIVSMGTFDKRKGADYFVKIAKQFAKKGEQTKIKMLWIGQRPKYHEALSYIYEEGRDAFVHLDEVKNPFPFLARADVFFLPSREDPFPLVALEAMALGKPVVAFADSGGVSEAGEGSVVLVDGFNTDRAAKTLEELISNAGERQTRGKDGQKRQKLYEKGPQLKKILEEIERIMPKKQ